MENKIKLFIINPELDIENLRLKDLGSILKQITTIEEFNLKDLSIKADVNYPFILDLLNQRLVNLRIRTLEKFVNELGYDLKLTIISNKLKEPELY